MKIGYKDRNKLLDQMEVKFCKRQPSVKLPYSIRIFGFVKISARDTKNEKCDFSRKKMYFFMNLELREFFGKYYLLYGQKREIEQKAWTAKGCVQDGERAHAEYPQDQDDERGARRIFGLQQTFFLLGLYLKIQMLSHEEIEWLILNLI